MAVRSLQSKEFKSVQREDEGSDEELQFTQTQIEWEPQQELHLEVKTQDFETLKPQERETLVNQCVRFLVLEGCMSRKPIKQDILRKSVLKNYPAKLVAPVLKEAQKRLRDLFGFDLVVARKVTAAESKEGPAVDKKSWFLKNIVRNETHLRALNSLNKAGATRRALATVVLALIFVNKKVLLEDELWQELARIDPACKGDGIKRHETFGDVTKLISKTFVDEKLLVRKERPGGEGERKYEYRIGPRALAEIGVYDIAAFVAQITGRREFKEKDFRQWAGGLAEKKLVGDDAGGGEDDDVGDDDGEGEAPERRARPAKRRRR